MPRSNTNRCRQRRALAAVCLRHSFADRQTAPNTGSGCFSNSFQQFPPTHAAEAFSRPLQTAVRVKKTL